MVDIERLQGKIITKQVTGRLIDLSIEISDIPHEEQLVLGADGLFHATGFVGDLLMADLTEGQDVLLITNNTENDSFSRLGARWIIKPLDDRTYHEEVS